MGCLTVPLPLPQLNDVLRAAKGHWATYAREKKRHTRRVALLARAARLRPVEGPVRLRFEWCTATRRADPDNVSAGGTKVVLDGLVAAGVLPDDSRAWVLAINHEFAPPDPKDPRVVVSWEEGSPGEPRR